MSILNHIIDYSKPRLVIDNIEVYHPTREQKNKLRKMIEGQTKLIINNDNLSLESEISDISVIRYMLEELTNQKEEVKQIADEELNKVLINADYTLMQVINELQMIIRECIYEIKNETIQHINNLSDIVDQGQIFNNLNKIGKDLGIDPMELLKMGQLDSVIKKMEEEKAKQDKNKKKRGRPKKQDKN